VIERSSGLELDRGGPYLDMSARTPMLSPFISASSAEAREQITAVMLKHGFVAYPFEFWHYSGGDVFAACIDPDQAAVYGPVAYDMSSGACSPLKRPREPIVTRAEIAAAIALMGT
jgi:hypothetical protein